MRNDPGISLIVLACGYAMLTVLHVLEVLRHDRKWNRLNKRLVCMIYFSFAMAHVVDVWISASVAHSAVGAGLIIAPMSWPF